MEQITLSEGFITVVTIKVGQETCMIEQEGRKIFLTKPQLTELARSIIESVGEWVSVDVKPEKTGLYHVKGGGWIYGFYNAGADIWLDLKQGDKIGITHYQPIHQPKP